ncbi:MAG: molybdopterin/thiamine biosynthesis adenylyltransferase [Halioglobus sp.]|jgi:adenylyltransferase/sulfurtransferase
MLSDKQLERYSRQILMTDFDIAGQEKLQAATVLVVGLGGLGCPAAVYLAAAGVGSLVLADGDVVELSNLQRQIAHGEANIGDYKAQSAADTIRDLNSEVRIEVVAKTLQESDLSGLLSGVDLVVDGSDNYAIRYGLNRACIAAKIPLVSAAAVRSEGQIAVFYPAVGGPCYRCLYPKTGSDTALSCSESGVLAPLVGMFGSLLAMEAIKVLSNFGDSLVGKLLVVDLASMQFQNLVLPVRPDCPDCQSVASK